MEYKSLINRLKPLELKIGYIFQDKNLLLKSMLHSSFVNENKHMQLQSNERLEFLGDAVLELAISKYLLLRLKDKNEGILSRHRSMLVQEPSLANLAKKLRLHTYLILGKGEQKEKGHLRHSVLADALEALIGAIYLDGEWHSAENFINNLFAPMFSSIDEMNSNFNYKNQLQEYSQIYYKSLPVYKLLTQTGPEHKKTFKIGVYLNSKYITWGSGPSIKKAEQSASKNALSLLKKKGYFRS